VEAKLSAMEPPETRYVTVGDAAVAYQVVGQGELDLAYCYGLGSHVELIWDTPNVQSFLADLAAFSRLVFFDRRGTGASDAVALNAMPSWEEWTEDVIAVLDAVGSTRTAVMATLDSGPMAILFAASHPERVSALILLNASARYLIADDYPIGFEPAVVDAVVQMVAQTWGTPEFIRFATPNLELDEESVRLIARTVRSSATPRAAAAQYDQMLRSLDVRSALPLVQAPTLVLHVQESPLLPLDHGRFIAEHIKGARLVELPGGDMRPVAGYVDEIAEFLTGDRRIVEVDRILTSILFTDIVGSTEHAASLGDQRWRVLLDQHDRAVRDQIRRFKGKEINTTGDGFVISFDGPARAIRCARAMLETAVRLGIELRVGLHTGECEVRGNDLAGLAVHIAARIAALAGPGEVLVSATVKDLVSGSSIDFVERGQYELKGVPGKTVVFAVE
jgi:class 3 adenylate cyclase